MAVPSGSIDIWNFVDKTTGITVRKWLRDSWARRKIVALQQAIAGIVVPTASTANPQMDGTAAPGSSTDYARADHVHPHDTSKADVATTYTKTEVNNLIPSVPSASTFNPAMDGTASPGSSTAWARGDHVHPSDTSKQDALTSAQMDAVNSGVTAVFVTGKFAVLTGTLPSASGFSAIELYPTGFTQANCVVFGIAVLYQNIWRGGGGTLSGSERIFYTQESTGVRVYNNNSNVYNSSWRVILMRTDV